MSTRTVQVKFSFSDWQRQCKSIYSTEDGIELSLGNFHSGTVFNGTLELTLDELKELRRALGNTAVPVFAVFTVVEEGDERSKSY